MSVTIGIKGPYKQIGQNYSLYILTHTCTDLSYLLLDQINKFPERGRHNIKKRQSR